MTKFTASNLFSQESRQRCIENLKKVRIPKYGKLPTTTAAVLIPLCVINGAVSLLYTVRSVQMRNHSGQTSFPGGKTDKGETFVDTAVREAEEEIGIDKNKIDIWGIGPPIPGSNYKILITPVVGTVEVEIQKLKINEEEVKEVFTVPLSVLCDSKNQFYTKYKNGMILPVFLYEQHKIWGITAYITHVFLTCFLSRSMYYNEGLNNRIPSRDYTNYV